MDDEVRNLVPSTLYQENACTSGHAAVWGSYYDPERKAWGYSCCRRLQRQEACPLAEAQEVAAESSDEEDPAEAAQRVAWQESKLLDAAPPSCLLPREQHATEEDFLTQFVLYWYHHWTNSDKSDQKGTREAFLALLKQLHRKSVDRKLLRQMADFAHLAQGREYAQANDVYIDITIGRATWHGQLDLGEQRAHWGQGCSLRTMQRQVVEKDVKNASAFDTDPLVQRYVHALKRMVTYMQTVQPSADPSKQGHVPAPEAKPDEVGLPVRQNIRDSDGRDHSPEFVDVNDASARDAQRGIAFGSRQDGRALPFVGIGFARGI